MYTVCLLSRSVMSDSVTSGTVAHQTPVHGISQARILGWVAILFSGDHPNPGIKPMSLVSSAWAGGFFTIEPPGTPMYPLPCVE